LSDAVSTDKVCPVAGSYGSKDWANEQLRRFIRVLKSDIGHSNARNLCTLARETEEDLRSAGFWWQADRVSNHLNSYLRDCQGQRPRGVHSGGFKRLHGGDLDS
jgi:predicted alpha-1,6-mannanase (GH76 family)